MRTLDVLHKDGTSYIQMDYHDKPEGLLVNGTVPTQCPGNERWCMVDGVVSTIQRWVEDSPVPTGYALRDKYKGLADLPATLPTDAEYQPDCRGNLELADLNVFYERTYSTPEQRLADVPFKVLDTDAQPTHLPDYVRVDFTSTLRQHPVLWYKLPCRISYMDVFNILHDRLAEIVAASGGKYKMESYKSVQAVTITEEVELLPEDWTERMAHPRRGKPYKVPVTTKTVEVLRLVGRYDDQRAIRARDVIGEDYQELQTKLEAYIQQFTSLLSGERRQVCPLCGGKGIATKEAR